MTKSKPETKPKIKYYTSLMQAGANDNGLYVNDQDALANRQFHNKFAGAFVDWTSNPSSNLDEIVDRQALFKKAFEIARDPKKKEMVYSLDSSFSDNQFTEDGIIQGQKDDFWKQYASVFELLEGEDNLPPQLKRLKDELAKNLPGRDKEQKMFDAIDDKIKESINSMGVLTYEIEFGSNRAYRNSGEEEDTLTFSFNLYPMKAGDTSRDSLPESVEELVTNRLKRYGREVIEKLISSQEVKDVLPDSNGKALISVCYTYSEEGFVPEVTIEDVTLSRIQANLNLVSTLEDRFLARAEQEILNKYGPSVNNYQSAEGGWLKRTVLNTGYWLADFARFAWHKIPLSAEYQRNKIRSHAQNQYGKFESSFRDSLKKRENLHLAAKIQSGIDKVKSRPEGFGKFNPDKDIGHELKYTTAKLAMAGFKGDIEKSLDHRIQYGQAIDELKGLVGIADKYLKLEKRGLPLCFPRFKKGDKTSVSAKGLYPIRLIAAGDKKLKVVPNDVELNGRPMVITGENGGGKSIYLYSIADMIVQAQTGFPIIAAKAEMSVVGGVYLHFVKPGDIRQGESRFINEVERVKQIVGSVGPNDVALFDELGSGTDLEGAMYISELVSDNMAANNVSTVLVTHLGDFAQRSKEKGHNVVRAGAGFKFEPGIGSSKGKQVAMKRGLTQEFFDKARKKGGK